jgi:hypothetical protein
MEITEMTDKTKGILVKVAILALIGVAVGVGAYQSRKKNSPQQAVAAQKESDTQSKTLYLSADGNDTNPGTKESPKQTVDAAVNAAKTGDKIVTKPKSTAKTSSG